MLGHPFDLVNGRPDPFDRLQLVTASQPYFLNKGTHLSRLASEFANRTGHLIHLRPAEPRAGTRFLNQSCSLAGRLGAPLGKVPHLLGHYCEAEASLTGPGRFDRRIEGQDVRLKGDLINHLVDPGDAVTGRVYFFHRTHHFGQLPCGFLEFLLLA